MQCTIIQKINERGECILIFLQLKNIFFYLIIIFILCPKDKRKKFKNYIRIVKY